MIFVLVFKKEKFVITNILKINVIKIQKPLKTNIYKKIHSDVPVHEPELFYVASDFVLGRSFAGKFFK